MRITLVSTGDAGRDAAGRQTAWWLDRVGHEVATVHAGPSPHGWPGDVVGVAPITPAGLGQVGAILRKVQPDRSVLRRRSTRVARAAATTDPHIVYPLARRDLDAAVGGRRSGWLLTPPEWPDRPSADLVRAAPHDPALSRSPAGAGLGHHLPGWTTDRPAPRPGRHHGTTVVMAYRETATTPARYLATAMERAGVDILKFGTRLDWDRVPDDAAAVVVVESLLPEIEIAGPRKDIPTLFWVHHGEHHLTTNLRLVGRYGADAVLLAHSWHLAHRFPVPVHRFPFGVAPELYGDPVPFSERRYDVAMVGSGLAATGGRYDARSRMVAALADRFGDRAMFPGRVSPEEQAEIYSNSRVVVNDGGYRHFPITMRVFEAIGAGALLLTEDQPGTDVLFGSDEYAVLAEDAADQVATLISDPDSGRRAAGALRHAMSAHTYDHRVDELLDIARSTIVASYSPDLEPLSPLAEAIRSDVDIDGVLELGARDLSGALPDRAIWSFERRADRRTLGTFDAAAIAAGTDDDISRAVEAARYAVYATPALKERVERTVGMLDVPYTMVERAGGVVCVDLQHGGGYRLPPEPEEGNR